jgi:hypothetical protein
MLNLMLLKQNSQVLASKNDDIVILLGSIHLETQSAHFFSKKRNVLLESPLLAFLAPFIL